MPLVSMIEGSPIAAVITNPRLPDNPIIACNPAFEDLTGYTKDEAIGRNCRFLANTQSNPDLAGKIVLAVQNRKPLIDQIVNFKKDGSRFLNAILIVPIFESDGELSFFLGSQAEVGPSSVALAAEGGHPAAAALASLSRRQSEVLAAMISGQRNKEIAFSLCISERTVKMHRAAVIAALGAKTSVDAIRLAIQAGWRA